MLQGVIFRPMYTAAISNDADIFTGLYLPCFSNFYFIIFLGHRTVDAPVEGLVLEIHDRIGIIDGSDHESFCICRCRRINYFESGRVHKPGFIALAVKWPCAYSTACWHTDHYIRILPPSVIDLRQVVDDLIEAYR